MEDKVRIYIKVDSHGNILDSYLGENVVEPPPYPFFFIENEAVAKNIESYKMVIDENLNTALVLKEEGAVND